MTLPVPGLTTAELVRLFEATHQIAADRDHAHAELAEERKLAAALGRDYRALKDRQAEALAAIAKLERELAEARRLVDRLRDPDRPAPLRDGARPHLGPPVRCWDGAAHGHEQAIALNAGRRDPIEANT